MDEPHPKIIRFGAFEINQVRGEMRRDGDVVELEPQVLDLLIHLANNHGAIVSRDDLIDAVWSGRIVSDSAISSRVSAARQALGDDGKSQAIIRTVPRRGFMFVPSPEIVTAAAPRSDGPAMNRFGARPSIVVLPFRNLSGDPEQGFFSEGIAEDITTSLARFEDLVVLARQSAFAFDASSDDPLDFSSGLGVGFVLEGSVQRSQSRIRVSARLLETATRATLWAEKFDRQLEDIFAVQDEISGVVVNALVGGVSDRHLMNIQTQAPRQIGAYDHALRAQQSLFKPSRTETKKARAEAEAALALEPDFARAHALLSWVVLTEDGNGWGESGDTQFDKAVAHGRVAVALDPKNPWGHALFGVSRFWQDHDAEAAIPSIRHAVKLNPSNAHFHMLLGATHAYAGDGAAAAEALNYSMDLNPLFPNYSIIHRARAMFVMGEDEAALMDATQAAASMPDHPTAFAMLAVCNEAVGQHDEAAQAILTLNRLSPEYSIAFARKTYPFVVAEHRDRFCRLLAQSGLKA